MSWELLLLGSAGVGLAVGLFVYWAIWVTEGAYFGRSVVRWLYDRGATTYDNVKQYNPDDEAAFLGTPLFNRLEEAFGPQSLLLDVASGTARLPLALFSIPFYEGEIVALDISREMLAVAAKKLDAYRDRITLLHHPSVPLPFASDTFDAVTSLEALEFMDDRRAALKEMVRVLRPGGWFVVTNRIGKDALMMPGRTDSPQRFEAYLTSLGLEEVFTRPWQEYYDLIFARKPGAGGPGRGFEAAWLQALQCPHCRTEGDSAIAPEQWQCGACDTVLTIGKDGVWEMV